MTIFTRKKLVLLIVLGIGANIGWKKLVEYADQQHIEHLLKKNRYAELATKQLQAEWQCLPDSETAREQFMHKVMQRFAPDDYAQLERGIAWVREYRVKMLTGELTVEERNNVKASIAPIKMGNDTFYTPPWTLESGRPTAYLTLNDCILNRDTTCPSIAEFSFQENGLAHIMYQTHGLRWRVTDEQWNELAPQEYVKAKNKDARFADLEEADKRRRALQYEAQQNVAKMSADEVPSSQEAQATQREYLKLVCR